MLTLGRFIIGILAIGYISMAAIRMYLGKTGGIWDWLNPRDPQDVRKKYGDRPPF